MNRGFRVLTSVLLAAAYAAVAVPAGLNLARADWAPQSASESAPPPAQQVPGQLSGPGTITALEDSAPVPEPKVLAGLLDQALAFEGGAFAATVADAATGQVLYNRSGRQPRIPASNMKLLTAAAALSVLGPDERFDTSVLRGGKPGTLVLRGGGDSLLTAGESERRGGPAGTLGRAGLATLAAATAKALRAEKAGGELAILVDDSAYAGPVISPGWDPADVASGQVGPVYPLAMYAGRASAGGAYAADPALAAGQAFRAALAEELAGSGLSVAGTVARGTAPAQAAELARVESAPVADQVDYMLQESDNYVAEVLARNTALASGKPGSFGGGTEAVREAVARLGVPTEGMLITDASGLSLRNRVSTVQLAAVVAAITNGANTSLRAGLSGLPIAGLSGTLDSRYTLENQAGAGLVRAKTGTLNAVTALTGYVVTAENRLLVFSFVANDLSNSTAQARAAADRAAALLAGCGCR
ncbi:D-alanyl-D-alanine carboxypeptidase/D-alanyl-D-alanine endopeptidase [Arthrobacter mobilis]|uniref:D-alanyl-D-alanine carboxypeptidase/D-alanyl-D-alanine-endopeptidase n=1 Tax=Arthrobacter mobilis TaxID=2724944 RepID=A0A7X6HG67_9MICC|nr:D-alanyl-D-alanine carboxypeptidase/D-alanyl-D-alanine-endopeptidase [Arthrobacter mobilis]NKX55097.1 D-alanyl-D-alanine carboxypeptidase/D-alanyl-D-alanine-endopeptidase [Arthrobacter mobilis]